MASSLRLPAGSFNSNVRLSTVVAQSFAPISHQCRSFSHAPQRWAYRSQNFTPPSMTQPSMKSRTREMLQGHLPNDIGLLPGTYVRPLWRDMPSIFGNPRDRWQMEYTWLKSALQNFMRWVSLGWILDASFTFSLEGHGAEKVQKKSMDENGC